MFNRAREIPGKYERMIDFNKKGLKKKEDGRSLRSLVSMKNHVCFLGRI